jgi:hypothetical protein
MLGYDNLPRLTSSRVAGFVCVPGGNTITRTARQTGGVGYWQCPCRLMLYPSPGESLRCRAGRSFGPNNRLSDLARRSRQACIDLVPDDGDQAGNVTEPERRDHATSRACCVGGGALEGLGWSPSADSRTYDVGYLSIQTSVRSWPRKWLGVMFQPFSLEEVATMRSHHSSGTV